MRIRVATALGLAVALAPPLSAQAVTSRTAFFPQLPETDYFLVNYSQYEAYLKKIAKVSPRPRFVDMGKAVDARTLS